MEERENDALQPPSDAFEAERLLDEVLGDVDETPLPSQEKSSSLYDDTKRAFIDALTESRDLLVGIVVEALQEVHRREYVEPEPDIPYDEHHHVMKLIFNLGVVGAIWIILSGVFIAVSGHPLRSGVAVVIYWAALILLAVLVSRTSRKLTGKRGARITRLMKIGWVAALVILGIAVILILASSGVMSVYTIGYLVVSATLVYITAREFFKWSQFHIYRTSGELHARRPASAFFFLNAIDETLILATVTTCELGRTWLEERLGMYKIEIDTAGDLDIYWNTLSFIKDGKRLQQTVLQGRHQALGI